MVTVNELITARQFEQRPGLLSEWVEQDMADILSEYGARVEDSAADRPRRCASPDFGYGVPMAGVRYYYTYMPEGYSPTPRRVAGRASE